jgi:hypothetical protein
MLSAAASRDGAERRLRAASAEGATGECWDQNILIWALLLEAESQIDDLVADVPLCGSTVMEEARQRGGLGSRLDLEEHPALHDEGAVAGRGDPDCACRGGVPLGATC